MEQNLIQYLTFQECWITSDRSNTIYFWDLAQENVCRRLHSADLT
jgi:hypothetical protein